MAPNIVKALNSFVLYEYSFKVLSCPWEWLTRQYTAYLIGEIWSQNYSQILNSFPNSFPHCLHTTLLNWSSTAVGKAQ